MRACVSVCVFVSLHGFLPKPVHRASSVCFTRLVRVHVRGPFNPCFSRACVRACTHVHTAV
uniref:Uncharacterized protein n=1 Tax=Anopheles minimus TaxID=112268 RepID=A0A182WND1_9DIPT